MLSFFFQKKLKSQVQGHGVNFMEFFVPTEMSCHME